MFPIIDELMEASYSDPSIHSIPEQESYRVTYQQIERGTERPKMKLVDSDGYSYNVKQKRARVTYWQCTVRPKGNACNAMVIQHGCPRLAPDSTDVPRVAPTCHFTCSLGYSTRKFASLQSRCALSPKRNWAEFRGPSTAPFKRRSLKCGTSSRKSIRTQSNSYTHVRVYM